ncbi:hypothetical protein Dimus_024425 [Dionaea muscipula]
MLLLLLLSCFVVVDSNLLLLNVVSYILLLNTIALLAKCCCFAALVLCFVVVCSLSRLKFNLQQYCISTGLTHGASNPTHLKRIGSDPVPMLVFLDPTRPAP